MTIINTPTPPVGHTPSVGDEIHAMADGGVSVIPADHRTKRPEFRLLPRDPETGDGTWKPFTVNIASRDERQRWIDRGGIKAYAVLCGRISGGLLVIDFDEPGFFEKWVDLVGGRADGLPLQRTQSGCWQLWLRCSNPGRNQRLAYISDESQESGRRVAIETRGDGGYLKGWPERMVMTSAPLGL